MAACLVRDECLSFSFVVASGNCSLHAVRGSPSRTKYTSDVIYRFRNGIGQCYNIINSKCTTPLMIFFFLGGGRGLGMRFGHR